MRASPIKINKHARHGPGERQARQPVAGGDGRQNDDERGGGARDLIPGPAEKRRQKPGDDGRVQTVLGRHPAGHRQRHGQGHGHQTHREARQQVPHQIPAGVAFGPAFPQGVERS
jgi:hypothetical protein